MASEVETPKREATPTAPLSSIPQKRALEEDHVPAVSSPLNPEVKSTPKSQAPEEMPARDKPARAKKDSLKKRESKGAVGGDSSRATPDPKQREPSPSESSPLRFKLAPPKQSDFEPPRGPVFTHHHDVPAPDGSTIEFNETSEHVYNKRNWHYTHGIADPAFPSSLYYRQTESEPFGPHLSFEDSATHMFFDQTARHITTDKGFRMARANVAVREGCWYWECKITRGILPLKAGEPAPKEEESHGHVRMGWARREASLDAPVGFDAYSYGIRDAAGQRVYMSRPRDFFPPGESAREGDVIGLEILLPPERLHRQVLAGHYNPAVDLGGDDGAGPAAAAEAPNVVRDRIPIRFKAHIYFEKIAYHTTRELEDLMNPSPVASSSSGGGGSGPAAAGAAEDPNPNHPLPALRTLPGSRVRVYKNGRPMGTAFESLLAFLPPASRPLAQVGARDGLDDGMLGYYPAVSVFRGGAAEVNFGPDFWFPPPGYGEGAGANGADGVAGPAAPRPLSERYAEQIAEDVVYDVVDEVDFWMQDGGRIVDRTLRDSKAETAGAAPGREEEIKELVQDD